MRVWMCAIVVTMRGWADVGLWVGVGFLAKVSLHRPRSTCKTTFARLTQSQAISQSFRVFITLRSMRDTTFFSFFETIFYTKLPFPLPWWSKDLLWRICRWLVVNFEIHLCSSDMKSDCIWRSISIQYVQIESGVNSDLGNGSFLVEIRDAKHVDWSSHLYM